MKYFCIYKTQDLLHGILIHTEYEMFDAETGDVFFVYKDNGHIQTSDDYMDIKDGLISVCLSVKDFDDQLSYDEHILPLFRDKKLSELGI